MCVDEEVEHVKIASQISSARNTKWRSCWEARMMPIKKMSGWVMRVGGVGVGVGVGDEISERELAREGVGLEECGLRRKETANFYYAS
jgi:hypothetical protein